MRVQGVYWIRLVGYLTNWGVIRYHAGGEGLDGLRFYWRGA